MTQQKAHLLIRSILLSVLSFGCIEFDHDLATQIKQSQGAQVPSLIIEQVKFLGRLDDSSPDYIQVIGSNLGSVSSGSLTGPGVNEQLFVDSRTENQVNLFANSPINLGIELIYNIVIANAEAQSAFPIILVIPNDTITETHILDGEVKPDLDLGAPAALAIDDGDILKWSTANNRWEPSVDARSSKLLVINDERNYSNYSKGLKELLKLNPSVVSGDTKSKEVTVGFMAHEIKKIIPSQTHEINSKGELNSEFLLGLTVNAIKELHQKLVKENSQQRILQTKLEQVLEKNNLLTEEKDQLKNQVEDILSRLRLIEEHLE